MMETYDYQNQQYFDLTGYWYDKPKRVSDRVGQFNELHTTQTNIRKEISQTLIDTIRITHYNT